MSKKVEEKHGEEKRSKAERRRREAKKIREKGKEEEKRRTKKKLRETHRREANEERTAEKVKENLLRERAADWRMAKESEIAHWYCFDSMQYFHSSRYWGPPMQTM